MRLITFLFSNLLFFFSTTLSAAPIFQITPSTTSISISPGGLTTINYTVKNVSGINIPQMSYSPSASTSIISSMSTCINFLANNASCSIYLLVAAPIQIGKLTLSLSVCGYHGRICSVPSESNRVQLTVETTQTKNMITAGSYEATDLNIYPLLAQSVNGSVWTYPISSSGSLPNDFFVGGDDQFSIAHCNGTLCLAGGFYTSTALGNPTYPLLARSQDGGVTWSYPRSVIDNLPSNFKHTVFPGLLGADCSGSLCVIAGAYSSTIPDSLFPLLAVSTDAGLTWNYPQTIFSNEPSDFIYGGFTTQDVAKGFGGSSSCSGNLCIAGGQYLIDIISSAFKPLLAESQDSGATWHYITTLPTHFVAGRSSYFASVQCNSSLCVAAGSFNSSGSRNISPLLAVTIDGGNTWTYPSTIISNLPANYNSVQVAGSGFFSVNCDAAFCAAGGGYVNNSGGFVPLLAVSQNAGISWNYPTVNFPADLDSSSSALAYFDSVSCNGNLCVAGGIYTQVNSENTLPLLAVSSDGGITWNCPPTIFSHVPPDFASSLSGFLTVTCQGNLCMAGGDYQTHSASGKPLLAISTDRGATWIYPSTIYTISNNLPADWLDAGNFNSGGLGHPQQ